jgi:CubicO group peptidase (beta-lactamase class C family)
MSNGLLSYAARSRPLRRSPPAAATDEPVDLSVDAFPIDGWLPLPHRGHTAVPMAGWAHPDFVPVIAALRRQLETHEGGAAVCVYHHGRCVVDAWGGFRDDAGTRWTADTMAPSFSTTKGVTSTALHILADRGLIDYDAPVAAYWPEFGRAGKDGITVRHVLTHRAGLYHIRQMIDRAERLLDWEHVVHAIERARPLHEPGTRTGYHGLTYGFLVGELIRRVTGKRFSHVVQDEIARPLGLRGLFVGAPRDELHRAAQLMWPRGGPLGLGRGLIAWQGPALGDVAWFGSSVVARLLSLARIELDLSSTLDALVPRGISSFDFGAHDTLRATIPSANGLFSARSLARMYAALAGGGALDGVRLLSGETLARATEIQSPHSGSHRVIPFDLRWRLGYHGVLTTNGIPPRAFGHFGFGGSGAWADPAHDLAVALTVNSGMGTPFGDFRIARVSAAALASVNMLARST